MLYTHLSTREKFNKTRRTCLITASGLDHDLHPSWRVKQSRVDKSRHAAIILRIFNLSLVTTRVYFFARNNTLTPVPS